MIKKLISLFLIALIPVAFATYNPPNPTTINGVPVFSDTHGNIANTNITITPSTNIINTISGDLTLNSNSGKIIIPAGAFFDITSSSPVTAVFQSRESGFSFPNFYYSAQGQHHWTTNNINFANLIYQGGSILAIGAGNGTSANGGTLLVDTLSTNSNDLTLDSASGNINIAQTIFMNFSYGTDTNNYKSLFVDAGTWHFTDAGGGGNSLTVGSVVTGGIGYNVNNQPFNITTFGTSTGADINISPGTGGVIKLGSKFYTPASTYNTGTISQSGLNVTGAGGATFSTSLIGGLFIPATGNSGIITSYNSTAGTIRTSAGSQTITAGTGYNIRYGGIQSDEVGNLGIQNLYAQGTLTIGSIISTINNDLVLNPSTGLTLINNYFAEPASIVSATVTQSGNTLTATTGTPFTAAMAGTSVIKIPGFGSAFIKDFTDSTHVTVDTSQTIATPTLSSINYSGIAGSPLGNFGVGGTMYANAFKFLSGSSLTANTLLALDANKNVIATNSATAPNFTTSVTTPLVVTPALQTAGSFSVTAGANKLLALNSSNLQGGYQLSLERNNYNTGTVSIGAGAVIGTGTTFTNEMVGGWIFIDGSLVSTIKSFTDATHITIADTSAVFSSGTSYIIYYGGMQADLKGNLGVKNIYFSNNTVSGYVSSPLNYYEEPPVDTTVAFTGAWAGNVVLRFTRIGREVLCTVLQTTNTATSATYLTTATGVVPAKFRPSYQIRHPFYVRDNGTDKAGLITFFTDGTIEISAGPGQDTAFAGSGSTGFFSQSIPWNL